MSSIKLLSWNVNGVRAAVKKGVLATLDSINADIVCLQEIKAKPEQIPQELMAWGGYTPYICSAERPGYSGVAVFTKPQTEHVAYGFCQQRFDSEGRTLVIDYP